MDPYSKQLLSLKEKGTEAAQAICSLIIEWKNNFSLNWYHQHIHEQQKNLDFVFTLLFQLTEFPDPNVIISTFNAIGALLVSLSPFCSSELIQSFTTTLSSLSVSPNTSCAAISTFVFLSHQVTDIKINQFIETIPILPHFGADLRHFISHIPNLIEQMDRLNLEFHQALLRSLISSFGRNPVAPFIESVMLLLKRYPERLVSDLMEFLESNKLDATLISIGGRLLRNENLSKYLTTSQKNKFLEIVKTKIFINSDLMQIQKNISATELEQSVSILTGIKLQKEENLKEEAEKVSQLILKNKTDYIPNFQRILIPLITHFNDLELNENDSTTVMSIKIMALKNIEDITDEQILNICEPFIYRRDEVFITVITFFAEFMKEKAYSLIEKVFQKSDYSWIQKSAILTLIDHLDQFKMSDLIHNYNKTCIHFLISCSLSPQTELSKQSREVVGRFVSINNVEIFRTAILNCDFFDPQMTKHILMLLNSIVNNISPYPLQCFIGIVIELLVSAERNGNEYADNSNSNAGNANDDRSLSQNQFIPSFVSDCFEFLSHFLNKLPYLPSIENICLKKMQEMYYSFTLEKLFFAADDKAVSTIQFNRIRPLLSTITTDVVADASLVQYEFLRPLRNCLQYLRANPVKKPIYYQILIKLLLLFPSEILPELPRDMLPDDFNRAMFRLQRLFNSSRDQTVIAKCCQFFIETGNITDVIVNEVELILRNTVIKTSSAAFVFILVIYKKDPEKAKDILKQLLNVSLNSTNSISPLPTLLRNELAVHLFGVDDLLIIFKNLSEYSFLQYKTSRYLAKQWFETHDYSEWPLNDNQMTIEIFSMFENNEAIHIKDCSKLDETHWNFVLKNRMIFCHYDYSDYIISNRISMMKICAFIMKDDHHEYFHFNTINEIDHVESIFPSASLLLKKGKLVSNEQLIKSFLMFSKIKIELNLIKQIEEKFPQFENLIKDYRERIALNINQDQINQKIDTIPSNNAEQNSQPSTIPRNNEIVQNVQLTTEEINKEESNEQQTIQQSSEPVIQQNNEIGQYSEQIPESKNDPISKTNECNAEIIEEEQSDESDDQPSIQPIADSTNEIQVNNEITPTNENQFSKAESTNQTNEIATESNAAPPDNAIPKSEENPQHIQESPASNQQDTSNKNEANNQQNASNNNETNNQQDASNKNEANNLNNECKSSTENIENTVDKFDELNNDEYIKYDPNFPIKSRCLKKLCQSKFHSILDLSLIRMQLFLKLDLINSQHKFFYFLRFLRVSLHMIENQAESKAILQNTIENFPTITTKLKKLATNPGENAFVGQTDYSFLVLEYMKLALSIINAEDVPFFCQKAIVPNIIESIDYLNLSNLMSQAIKLNKSNNPNASNVILDNNSLMTIKSANFLNIPSFLMYIIKNIERLPLDEANQFISTNYKDLFEQKLVSDELIEFLSKSPKYLPAHFSKDGTPSTNEYFNGSTISQIASIVVDPKSPIFTITGECHFFSVLFDRISGQHKRQLNQFQSVIEKLPVCGYSSSFSMELIKSYYSAIESNLMKNSKSAFYKDYGIKEIRTAQSVYLKYPSILNSLQLSDILNKGSDYFDSLALIFGKFGPIEDLGFLGTFCIAFKFYAHFYQDRNKREKFASFVSNFKKTDNIKSRQIALELIVKDLRSFDVAFVLACLETNDEEKINEIIHLLE